MNFKKMTGFIGAEVTGLDNEKINSSANRLKKWLEEFHVLVFRGQHMSIGQQKEISSIFGELVKLPYIEPTQEDEFVIAVLKEAYEINTGVFGGDWHSDFSFLKNPPAGSVLNAIEIPEVGGDTLWVNQVEAYRSLPNELREFLDHNKAIHTGKPYGVKHAPAKEIQANASIKMSRGDPKADQEMVHPAVVTSPDSGEKAIFVNPIYTTRFAGMSDEQSAPWLEAIYKHGTKPDFAYRHQWQVGDLVVWNNRTTLHYATNDYAGYRRLLYRTTFSREVPQ